MSEFFEIVAKLAVVAFVVTCMVTVGLGLSVRDVAISLRRLRLVALAILINFVLAPMIAYALISIFPLERPYEVGLLLLSAAAGAPFLPKLAALARGDIAFSVGLMLLLTVGSIICLPMTLPLLIPGQSANTWPILRSLLLTMLLPLGFGIALRAGSERWANRLQPVIGIVANVSMMVAVGLLVGLNFTELIRTIGSGAVAVAALFVLILLALGYAFGGPQRTTRSVLGVGSGQRNIAAALIVASQNSDDARVVVMLLVSTLVGLVVLVPAAFWFARRSTAGASPLVDEPRQSLPEVVVR